MNNCVSFLQEIGCRIMMSNKFQFQIAYFSFRVDLSLYVYVIGVWMETSSIHVWSARVIRTVHGFYFVFLLLCIVMLIKKLCLSKHLICRLRIRCLKLEILLSNTMVKLTNHISICRRIIFIYIDVPLVHKKS